MSRTGISMKAHGGAAVSLPIDAQFVSDGHRMGTRWAPRQFAEWRMPRNHLKRLARPTGWAFGLSSLRSSMRTCDPCLRRAHPNSVDNRRKSESINWSELLGPDHTANSRSSSQQINQKFCNYWNGWNPLKRTLIIANCWREVRP